MSINIVLYSPEIPQNTGNIMRTCVATNIKLHLIKPLGFELTEKTLKRSALDYYEYLDYTVYENWEEFVSKNNGEYYFLTRYGKKTPGEFNFSDISKNIYLVFGRESTGVPKEILKEHLETCIRLPMSDKVRSLNLSNCACVLAYEVLRQRNYEGLITHEPENFKGEDFLEK